MVANSPPIEICLTKGLVTVNIVYAYAYLIVTTRQRVLVGRARRLGKFRAAQRRGKRLGTAADQLQRGATSHSGRWHTPGRENSTSSCFLGHEIYPKMLKQRSNPQLQQLTQQQLQQLTPQQLQQLTQQQLTQQQLTPQQKQQLNQQLLTPQQLQQLTNQQAAVYFTSEAKDLVREKRDSKLFVNDLKYQLQYDYTMISTPLKGISS